MDKIRDIEVGEYDFEFISTNDKIYDKSLLRKHEIIEKITPPIPCETNGRLIKMNTPCKSIRENFKVIFRDHGEFIVKEVIDDSNFTIVMSSDLPKNVILEDIGTKNVKVIKSEYRDVLPIYAIKEIDKEILDIRSEIVTNVKYNTLNSRISILENIIVSLYKRIDALEKV